MLRCLLRRSSSESKQVQRTNIYSFVLIFANNLAVFSAATVALQSMAQLQQAHSAMTASNLQSMCLKESSVKQLFISAEIATDGSSHLRVGSLPPPNQENFSPFV
jgi:hypothetical protein